jgi:hypothetical protein
MTGRFWVTKGRIGRVEDGRGNLGHAAGRCGVQRLLAFLIARGLVQGSQHAANQQAKSITGGEPIQHIDHLCDLGRIHRARPQSIHGPNVPGNSPIPLTAGAVVAMARQVDVSLSLVRHLTIAAVRALSFVPKSSQMSFDDRSGL